MDNALMKLEQWLKSNNMSAAAFAKRIGVARCSVYRYVSGERVPSRTYMGAILKETGGKVTANDFDYVATTPPAKQPRRRTPP